MSVGAVDVGNETSSRIETDKFIRSEFQHGETFPKLRHVEMINTVSCGKM